MTWLICHGFLFLMILFNFCLLFFDRIYFFIFEWWLLSRCCIFRSHNVKISVLFSFGIELCLFLDKFVEIKLLFPTLLKNGIEFRIVPINILYCGTLTIPFWRQLSYYFLTSFEGSQSSSKGWSGEALEHPLCCHIIEILGIFWQISFNIETSVECAPMEYGCRSSASITE